MTKTDLLKERDRLAIERIRLLPERPDFTRFDDYSAGFDACLKLMEEGRVRPLREAIEQAKMFSQCVATRTMLSQALALVPEFEK